jgi:hypothetical protein
MAPIIPPSGIGRPLRGPVTGAPAPQVGLPLSGLRLGPAPPVAPSARAAVPPLPAEAPPLLAAEAALPEEASLGVLGAADMPAPAEPAARAIARPTEAGFSFSGKIALVVQTIFMTLSRSIGSDCKWLAISAPVGVLVAGGALFAQGGTSALVALQDLRAPVWTSTLATALGTAFAIASVRSFRLYLFSGMQRLKDMLSEFVPSKAVLASASRARVIHYFGLMRFSAALAFVYELGFQTLAFAFATWGVATAFPSLGLFSEGAMVTLAGAIAFWFERMFQLIDGPATFGFSSGLRANPEVWGFGIAIVLFKAGVIATLVRLVSAAVQLKPSDLSDDFAEALARNEAAGR